MTSTTKDLICQKCNYECNHDFKSDAGTYLMGVGWIGVLVSLAAIPMFFVNILFGFVLLILGIFIAAMAPKGKMVKMICPKCNSIVDVIRLGNYKPNQPGN